jgi:hypothetical protein
VDAKSFIEKYDIDVTATHMGDHTVVYPSRDGTHGLPHEWRVWALAWLYTDEQGHRTPESEDLEEALYDLKGAVVEGGLSFEEFVDERDHQKDPHALYRGWIAAVELRHRVLDWLALEWLVYQPLGEPSGSAAGIALDRRSEFLTMDREDEDE